MQWEPIIAAATTGVLALIGVIWQSRKTRRVNTEEHAYNSEKLDQIQTAIHQTADKVEDVAHRLDDHLTVHRMTRRKWWQ